jgi:hypothetical protein
MSVEVVDIDIVSDVADALLSARFCCCARLAVGDKSFTNDMDNGLAGTGGGANFGMGSGDELLPITGARNGGGDGESPLVEESGDISEPSGLVMITL